MPNDADRLEINWCVISMEFFFFFYVHSLQRWDRWRHVFENDETILFKKFKKRKEKKKITRRFREIWIVIFLKTFETE